MARKSSGCVVYRFNEEGALEILLVTRRNGKSWVLPKGGIEPDMSARESAAKEVYEEAGAEGIIASKLGKYKYMKDGVLQKVVMFAMRYTNDSPDWPEEHMRRRQWFPIDKAEKKVDEYLAVFIHKLRKETLSETE